MPKKIPFKYDIVEIKWIDAVSYDSAWCSHNERLTEAEYLHKSSGYFLSSKEDLTHICRSYRISDGTIEGLMAIPTGCIQSIKVIKKATEIPEET